MDESADKESRTWWFPGWDGVLTILTVSGLVAYATLRLSAGIFYRRFGFRPEEVGLGYLEMLSHSLPTLLFWGIFFTAMYGIWQYGVRRDDRYFSVRWRRVALLTPIAAFAFFTLAVRPMWVAVRQADAIEQGDRLLAFPSDWKWDAPVALLSPVPPGSSETPTCVVFLGHANGVMAFYDPGTRTSWRVPVGSVIVQTGLPLHRAIREIPEDCPPS